MAGLQIRLFLMFFQVLLLWFMYNPEENILGKIKINKTRNLVTDFTKFLTTSVKKFISEGEIEH